MKTPSLTSPPLPAPHKAQAAAQPAAPTVSDALAQHIGQAVRDQGGWIGFDTFMALALYTPGLGYYAADLPKFGAMPAAAGGAPGSDFVTAPEISPLFGYALARQVAQALQATGTDEVWEFGAGTGALAEQVLSALREMQVPLVRYTIVDLSGSLRARQQSRLAPFGDQVQWVSELPAQMRGVVLGNELIDAMPVQLLARVGGVWHERGVALAATPASALAGAASDTGDVADGAPPAIDAFVWSDRPTALRPPVEIEGAHDYLTEIHPQSEAFVRTLAQRLERGAVFLLDYGFPEAEYYHPQRHMGTVMCHQAHRSDADPLVRVGEKDITAHVNFTSLALAAQDAGLEVLGYTSQAHFLINCGLVDLMQAAALPVRASAQRLILEHEMGELFKVIALGVGAPWQPLGFGQGDRMHRL
jgi:SAM-dependent MidA family methyltransferase